MLTSSGSLCAKLQCVKGWFANIRKRGPGKGCCFRRSISRSPYNSPRTRHLACTRKSPPLRFAARLYSWQGLQCPQSEFSPAAKPNAALSRSTGDAAFASQRKVVAVAAKPLSSLSNNELISHAWSCIEVTRSWQFWYRRRKDRLLDRMQETQRKRDRRESGHYFEAPPCVAADGRVE